MVFHRTAQSFSSVLALLGIDGAGHIRAAEILPATDVHLLPWVLVPLYVERYYAYACL
jgi:hypothetical protein